MLIPIPCKFGEIADCNGKQRVFNHVSWFKWSKGFEYTYFFRTNNIWDCSDFYCSFSKEQPEYMEISDSLLLDAPIKDRGHPLKGVGYACGICYENGKLFMEFILTSNFYTHIKVECDKRGNYVSGGDIKFPPTPSWDTEEKREKIIYKSLRYVKKKTRVKALKQEFVQYDIYNYISD